jgi:hypothetical protein
VPFSLPLLGHCSNLTPDSPGDNALIDLLQKIPYTVLIPIAVIMLLAPFKPMPHVLEKLIMLKAGNLSRPIDIFDLIYHLAPLILLAAKVFIQIRGNGGA